LKCRGGSDFPEFSNQFSFPSHDDSQNEKMTDTPSLFPHKKITKTVLEKGKIKSSISRLEWY